MGKGRRQGRARSGQPALAQESVGQPVGAPRSRRSEAQPSRPPDVPQGVGRAHRALALSPSSVLGAAIIAAYATTIGNGPAHHAAGRDVVVLLVLAEGDPS